MKIKVTKVVFEEKQKEFDLPFPIYLEEFKSIKPEALINKISKYDWPEDKKDVYQALCTEIRTWATENTNKEEDFDESSRQIL